MKKILLSFLAALGLAACQSSSTQSPEASLTAFLQHLERQEYLKAQSYASAASAEILDDQARSKPSFELAGCNSLSQDSSQCVIRFCQTFDGEKQCESDTFLLVYEAKSWRVDWKSKVESQMGMHEEALREQLEQLEQLKNFQESLEEPQTEE